MAHELDIVELKEWIGSWPEGTRGTIVDVPAEGVVTVEIDNELVDPRSPLLDALIDVPESSVRVVTRHPQPA
jgi:hypothetical protein